MPSSALPSTRRIVSEKYFNDHHGAGVSTLFRYRRDVVAAHSIAILYSLAVYCRQLFRLLLQRLDIRAGEYSLVLQLQHRILDPRPTRES